MHRVCASIVLVAVCACRKHEEATPSPSTTTPPPPAPSASASAAEIPSAAPSAAPSASAPDAREAALREAQEFGMMGLIGLDAGPAQTGATGNMWGDAVGDSFGAGGVDVVGPDGGSGRGGAIGLGNLGTLGHGGHYPGRYARNSPRLRQGPTTVTGGLPPEVVQRIVRQNFGRFRLCYENGLRGDPKLAGTVATKFVIDAQGAVTSASRDAATTMRDASVVACVTRGFSNLSFPQPEGGGTVTVIYPVIFEPPATPP